MRDLLGFVLALCIALGAAGIVWIWWRGPIPTFMVFTPILHGMMVGLGLMWVVERFGKSAGAMRVLMGVAAGVGSVVALLAGQYVSDAYEHGARAASAIRMLAPGMAAGATARSGDGVLSAYDRNLLEPKTGHAGLIGYLHVKHRGQRWRWVVHGVETLLVAGIATGLCLSSGRRAPPEVH